MPEASLPDLPPAQLSARLTSLYPTLGSLPELKLREFVDRCQTLRVPAGTRMFDDHTPCQAFPMLLEGSIRVAKASASGRELLLYRVLPSEACVLTSSCLLGRHDYSARGTVEQDALLLAVPQPAFFHLVDTHPPFREYIFALFAERITELMELVEAVAFRRLDQRLAALLLGKGREVHATHQQLAEELGSVREIVTRLLKHFAEDGLVGLGRERVEILDPAGLRRIATD
ncbi:MAG: Crp/Fnr family transcriptional regulator [Betaproteobacteria bacterium]|nr:Crp/Fnr family transcriptional regulator [Betaproteobacteria bacterium]